MNALILPLLIPFLTAVGLALLRERHVLEKALSVASSAALTAFTVWLLWVVDREGPQATVLGGWAAPFGIAFVADRLAALFVCLSSGIGTVVLVYTLFTVEPRQQDHFFYPLFQFVLLGVNWSFLTGDLFNLFVAYEVMLIGSYGVMSVGASRPQIRETMKYLAINSIGSAVFLMGIGLVYATTGTLNFADLAVRTADLEGSRAALVTAVSMFLLTIFALKAAAFPLIFWLPDSYPVIPPGVIGYFGGLLTKVGVYSLLRVFGMVFQQEGWQLAADLLLLLSGFTMLLGVLGAMCQWEIRRLLSWHIVSQVGYMIMGIGLARNPAVAEIALAGTILHVAHNMIVKSSLFLIGGIGERITGTQELKRMGGLVDVSPGVAGLFLVAAFSLAGMPPFSGFVSKLVLVQAGLGGGNWIIVAVAIVTSFFTLYSMAKIWSYAFWGERSVDSARAETSGLVGPVAVLVVATTLFGLGAGPAVRFAQDAAAGIVDPTDYIEKVLGEGR